ncbi:MAG: ABC transporter substrate-binding protein [Terriglobia bacterium]
MMRMSKTGQMLSITTLVLALLDAGCSRRKPDRHLQLSPQQFAASDWNSIVERARGTTVAFAAWAGDEERNRYFQGPVTRALKSELGITLHIIPLGDTVEAVNKLLAEKGAGKTGGGSIDLVWINGENFRTARQGGILWGPFSNHLPNIKFFSPEAQTRDFGTPIDGYEAPWESGQFVMAYDSARVPSPPLSISAIKAWVKDHPGRFTYIAPPDFTGSAFIRHLLIFYGGGAQGFQQNFNAQLYEKASAATIRYLNAIKPYLWRHGDTYPTTTSQLDRLFANDEVDFAMSYGPSFASERIDRGQFPPTTRTFVFDEGTLGNFSYLAIPYDASNVAGALAAINFLMSPSEEIEASRILANPFPLALVRLSPVERHEVETLGRGPATLPTTVLQSHRLPEPNAEYLKRLEKDWETRVLEK